MSQAIKVGIAGLGRSGWNMHANASSAVPVGTARMVEPE